MGQPAIPGSPGKWPLNWCVWVLRGVELLVHFVDLAMSLACFGAERYVYGPLFISCPGVVCGIGTEL